MSSVVRALLVALVAFAVDQASKYWIVLGLDLLNTRVIEVFPPYLVFIMGFNRGINFGLFGDGGAFSRMVLIAFAVIVSAALAWWARSQRGWLIPAAIGLIIGGALGNALDRVIWGAVLDFLNMSCCGIRNPYVFNIADIFIFLGAIILVIWSGKETEDPQNTNRT